MDVPNLSMDDVFNLILLAMVIAIVIIGNAESAK